jgi:aryl sulfotransferase
MAGAIVWLASYPKSGNTWLRLLLANLLSCKAEAADINEINLPRRDIVSRGNFEEITLVDSSLLTHDEVDALRPQVTSALAAEAEGDVYVKVHDAYRLLANGEPLLGQGQARAALYVLRDPRDVAISASFHNGTSIEKAIALLNNPQATLNKNGKRYISQVHQLMYDWSGHVESWADQRDVPVYVIRYEDLHDAPAATLLKASDFLGFPVSAETVEHAVRYAEFSGLQRKEQEAGFRERPIWSTTPFFRSGRAGGWREVLSLEQQQAITGAHRRVMERFGYI